jgi:aldose 1-epimerase
LEDPRLSRMYWALLKQGLARRRRSVWHAAVLRSGMLTVLVLIVVLVVLAVGWREHRLGQFAQLKKSFKPPSTNVVTARPGGQEAIHLLRSPMVGGNGPEFLSATLLPGRGMNVLQIGAYLPGKGEVNLLASPPLEEAATRMSGSGADVNGAASLDMGGAVEAPWAGRISGVLAPEGGNLTTMWHGMRLTAPADPLAAASGGSGEAMASGGLLLKQPSTSVNTNVMPDGGQAQATFEPVDFDGRWPSSTEITASVVLSGKSIEIKILARNTGKTAEPVGLGWHPRFAILNGHRGQMMLRLPQSERVDVKDRRTEELSGKLLPVAGTEYDFTGPSGAKIGALNLDDTFVHLRQGLMDSGPIAELRDPDDGYGLRITALSPAIKAFHVEAPSDGSFISIDPQFNFDDPFGREWSRDENTGMVVLQPGQSTLWYIRMEIFSLNSDSAEHL